MTLAKWIDKFADGIDWFLTHGTVVTPALRGIAKAIRSLASST